MRLMLTWAFPARVSQVLPASTGMNLVQFLETLGCRGPTATQA